MEQPFGNHNGGQLLFHNGLLLIFLGDGGGGGDPLENGLNRLSVDMCTYLMCVNGCMWVLDMCWTCVSGCVCMLDMCWTCCCHNHLFPLIHFWHVFCFHW